MQIDASRSSRAQSAGRQGVRVDRIVWHHTGGGSVAGALNWVTRPGATESYHYLVDEGGRIFRVVPEQNTSWHSGNWSMNLRSIGVCHPVNGGGVATRNASVSLAADICRRFGIPASGNTIIPHRAVIATACPGALPMAEWIALVAGGGLEEEDMFSDQDRTMLQFLFDRLNNISGPRPNGEWPTLGRIEDGIAATFSDQDRELLQFLSERLNNISGPRPNGEWPTLGRIEDSTSFTHARLNDISGPTPTGQWPTLAKLTEAVNMLLERQGLPPVQ